MLQSTLPQGASQGLPVRWSWCAQCQRTYMTGTCRLVHFGADALHPHPATLHLCPYTDCYGSTARDGWLWSTLRHEHPAYPLIPERGVVYLRSA